LLGYSLKQAGEENITYLTHCASDVSNKYDGLGPLYYCGKLTVNGIFIAAGIGISRVYDRYAFKRAKISSYDKLALKETPEVNGMSKKIIIYGDIYSKNFDTLITKISRSFARDKQERFVKRMTMMDESMQKEYLNNVNKYVNDFEVGGKYNMLISKQTLANCVFCKKELSTIFSN
jgi:hypothetical protein